MRGIALAFVVFGLLFGCKDVLYEDASKNLKLAENKVKSPSVPQQEEELTSIIEGHLKNQHSDSRIISQTWPRIQINTDVDGKHYGIEDNKLKMGILSISKPEPYAWLNIMLTNLEKEDVEIGFFVKKPSIRLYTNNVRPINSDTCEFEKIEEREIPLFFDLRNSFSQLKAFSIKHGKIESELSIRPSNDMRYFTIKPQQEVVVRWFFSHDLGDKRRILTGGVLPSVNKCRHKQYEEFYAKCHKTTSRFNFLDGCNEFMQMDYVKYATIDPLDLSYNAQMPGNKDIDQVKHLSVKIQKPPKVILY